MKQLFSIILVLVFAIGINAQQSPGKDHSKLNISCKTCHSCDVPTKNDPCLVICPREKITTVYQKPEETPELITINQLSERYGPVYFSHKIHAQMSICLLYTSDAADERSSVDLGGRRIIKKKKISISYAHIIIERKTIKKKRKAIM